VRQNPFPGPRPYNAADRHRFFGREALVEQLANRVRSRPCTTVSGPSGAGKSSLMQAGVIPLLLETYDYRVVRVDAWPVDEPPLRWLVREIYANLDLGAPPADEGTLPALDEALSRAEMRSERPILIYLDQLEQPLFAGRKAAGAEALIEAIDRLANQPLRGLTVVLSVREDYLGRLRDRVQGRRELLDHGFRVPPLSVGEMVKAVCQAVAETDPERPWDREEIRRLMHEVRVPGEGDSDEAEVQAAFGQIVCRALWEERAPGNAGEARAANAEAIVHRYLDATMEELGARHQVARRLLEDALIDEEGNRLLLTEQQARAVLPGAAFEILAHLEQAAVLHSEAHQGSRYFEIGHDWLASKVFEQREERKRQEERRWAQRMDKWRRRHPVTTAFIAGVVLFVLAMTAAAFSVAADQEDDRRKELLQTNVRLARAVAGAVNAQLKDFRDDVARAAADFPPALMDTLRRPDPHPVNEGPLRDYCKSVHQRYDRHRDGRSPFESWFLLGKDGIYRARSEEPRRNVLGERYDWRRYFQGAQGLAAEKVRSAYVSPAFISSASATERFAISAPIYDAGGEWIGVIAAMTDTGATLGPLSLHDRNDNRITAVVAPQDRERAGDELPSDYVIIIHPHLLQGARTPLSGAWVRDLVDRAEQTVPQTGLEQLRMADAGVVKQDAHYVDPVKSDYAGQWLAGFAPVGHTGFAVIVQSREQEARDLGTRLPQQLAKWAGPATSPGVLLVIFALWSRRRRAGAGAAVQSGEG
jgi:hypothetical protein